MTETRPPIPILRVPFDAADRRFIEEGLREVLDSGVLSMGDKTKRFEEAFASWTGAEACISCSNGTSALEIILRAIDVLDREVIVPTNTFMATALAVLHAGGKVVFADSEPTTLCLDPRDLEAKITDRTAAVVLVHIGGVITPAIDEIVRICEERSIPLVEDCAHAHGCTYRGRPAGTIGVAGAFSFFPTKVLTTGEGGTITTNDPDLAAKAMVIRNQGKDPSRENHIAYPGHNFRISEATAVIGLQQLRKADELVADRQRIAGSYDELLEGQTVVTPLRLPPDTTSSYYKYVVFLPEGVDRSVVKSTMKEQHGVSLTGEVYADPCHAEPIWDAYTYCGRPRDKGCAVLDCGCEERQDGFPGARQLSKSHICLPLYPGLTSEDTQHVVERLVKVVEGEVGS